MTFRLVSQYVENAVEKTCELYIVVLNRYSKMEILHFKTQEVLESENVESAVDRICDFV